MRDDHDLPALCRVSAAHLLRIIICDVARRIIIRYFINQIQRFDNFSIIYLYRFSKT